jgi:hydroxymethylbilane synthase
LVDERIEFLDPSIFPYAVGQGALGVQCRRNDTELVSLLKSIEHRVSRAEVDAERALMGHLGAGCSLPLGVYVYWHGDVFTMYARVTSPDGSRKIQATGSAGAVDTENLGRIVSELLLEAGAGAILTEVAAQACLGTTTQKLY